MIGRVKVNTFQKNPTAVFSPHSYWRCCALSGLATLLTLTFRTPRPSSALGIIEGVILRLSRPLTLGACILGGVDGMAACGCWYWLVFDGREGVRCVLVVFKRGRARVSVRRLDGDRVDLAAGRPKPRKKIFINVEIQQRHARLPLATNSYNYGEDECRQR